MWGLQPARTGSGLEPVVPDGIAVDALLGSVGIVGDVVDELIPLNKPREPQGIFDVYQLN